MIGLVLEIVTVWAVLCAVTVAGWHAAHVVARRRAVRRGFFTANTYYQNASTL